MTQTCLIQHSLMNKHRNQTLLRCVHPAFILALMIIISCTTLAHSQSLDFQAMCATHLERHFKNLKTNGRLVLGRICIER
jgi:hypothetical protein